MLWHCNSGRVGLRIINSLGDMLMGATVGIGARSTFLGRVYSACTFLGTGGQVVRAGVSVTWNVMIWRSWVRTPVRSNLGWVELLSKSYLNQNINITVLYYTSFNDYYTIWYSISDLISPISPVLNEYLSLKVWSLGKWRSSAHGKAIFSY